MPGRINEADYEYLKNLGQGGFGFVYKVRRKSDNQIRAIKKISYKSHSDYMIGKIVDEINVLSKLRHPNIVTYYGHVVHRKDYNIFIYMEFCENGDLANLIHESKRERKKISERFTWGVGYQILNVLSYINGKNLLHRDLKPANVLLTKDYSVRVADFGMVKIHTGVIDSIMTVVGTPVYMAPEMLARKFYDERADIWSLGMILFEMCNCFRYDYTKHWTFSDKYTEEMKNFVSLMLQKDMNQRIKTEDALKWYDETISI